MKLKRTVTLMLCSLAISTQAQQSKPDFIEFQGAKLHLGMTVAQVTALLASNQLALSVTETPEKGVITSIIVGKLDTSKAVGAVKFRGDKLVGVRKTWDIYIDPPRTLFYLLQQFTNEGRSRCIIDSWSKDTVTSQLQTAFITCGAKAIKIYWFDHHETKMTVAGLDEVLGEENF